jgi:hypothetical protein
MKWTSTFIGLGILTFNFFITAPVQAGVSEPSCYAPPSGIVGWWPGEGNANDVIGGDNGTLEGGATFAPGMVGQGFRLDGTNGDVMIPDSAALKPANVTVEAWVWLDPNVSPANEHIIFKKNSWDAFFEGYSLLKEHVDNGNGTFTDRFSFVVSSGGDQVITRSTTVVQRGVWYHVAGTYDGTTATLWVNGVAEASAVGGFALDYGTTPVFIGTTGVPGVYINRLAGIIDEPSIYNRALSTNEIEAIYNAGSAGKCAPVTPPVPVITSFSPLLGTNGEPVMISGTNFSATAADNIVYFGAVQATVLSASPTELVVTVPVGATYAPVTVTVDGLTAYSAQSFEPTFLGSGSGINSSSFGPRLDLPAGNGVGRVIIADLDGDGKPDLIMTCGNAGIVSIYRNISTNGSLTADSFAPRVDLAAPSADATPYDVEVADVDGDGKLDIVVSDYGIGEISVYQNTCTPGNISSNTFATRVDFPVGTNPQVLAIRDMDGDGKPDVLVANAGDSTVSILRNTSTVGSLNANSFAPKVDIATGSSCDTVAVGDLDGDGKPDMVVGHGYNTGGNVSLFRNISSPGSITTNSFAPQVDLPGVDYTLNLAIVDLDGDGKLDLVAVSYLAQTFSVFRNTSTVGSLDTNSFAPRIDYSLGGRGHTPAVGDLDGDGKPDLALVTELDSLLSIFQNTSTPGSFTADSLAPRVDFSTGWNAWGVSIGDLDGDGRPDVVFCNDYDSSISIYQNTVPFSGPPFIQTQPTNQTAEEGSSVVLSVAALGAAPLSYQWKFNGTTISGATNAMLTLTNLHPNQAGNYNVRVANSFGAVTSSNAMVTVVAQDILVYKYSGVTKVTTAGLESSHVYSGQMFFTPATTNGIFVGWAMINGEKQFWVTPFSDYLLVTIPGSARHTYTILGKAGEEIDDGGYTHIWSYLHKGLNTSLTIGKKRNFSFPNTFSASETHVYPDSQTADMILLESVSSYTFLSSNTQTANNNGQTMADLVNALTRSLLNQGYKQQQN